MYDHYEETISNLWATIGLNSCLFLAFSFGYFSTMFINSVVTNDPDQLSVNPSILSLWLSWHRQRVRRHVSSAHFLE